MSADLVLDQTSGCGCNTSRACDDFEVKPQHCSQLFYGAAGAGSWHEVVADSGHAQFCDAGPILNRGLRGAVPERVTAQPGAVPLSGSHVHTVPDACTAVLFQRCAGLSPAVVSPLRRMSDALDRTSLLWRCRP